MITEFAKRVLLDDVVIDMAVYPRTAPSEATIRRYAEALQAGDKFPAIVLQQDTNLLLDGLHRWKAHILADFDDIEIEYHVVPEGMPVKLYAASLSARNGDRITKTDMKTVARDTIRKDPHYSQKEIAKRLGFAPQTISNWVSDITEHHRDVLKVRALILSRLGHTQEQIAGQLGRKQNTISEWISENPSMDFPILSEELLQEAIEAWPGENGEVAEVVERLRQEMIFGHWSEEERDLLDLLRGGDTVVVNMRDPGPHGNLVPWLRDTNQLIRIGRKSPWGNPFEIPDDGDRETVVANYEEHYLPFKPSLLDRLEELRGKALGCWCAPERCHGDVLLSLTEQGA